ncbi:LOW QUALITY PROTEIN: hypothetical protein ACHAW6_010031 [Cyclotella cf. meneghiniana]
MEQKIISQNVQDLCHPTLTAYIEEIDKQFNIHRIEECLIAIDEATKDQFPLIVEYQEKLEKLDAQTKFSCTANLFVAIFTQLTLLAGGFPLGQASQDVQAHDTHDQRQGAKPRSLCKQARKLGIVAP